jgi:hypothetical protein
MAAVLIAPNPAGWKQLDAQRSYPGNGATPTRGWQAGDIYRDRMVFYPRGEFRGPTTALLTVGLLDGKRKLPCARNGASSDLAREMVVRPESALVPTDRLGSAVNFGDLFDLVGITPATTTEGSQVTLWWQAKSEPPKNYTVFVHLLDQQGQVIAQSDSPPDQGLSPTTTWRKGDVIQDTHTLPAHASPGGALLIGVYDLATLERLPATQNGQVQTNNAFRYPLP